MNLTTLADNGNASTLNGVGQDAGQLAKQTIHVGAGIAAGNGVYRFVSGKMGSTKGKLGIAKKAGAALLGVFAGLATNKIGAKLLKTDTTV